MEDEQLLKILKALADPRRFEIFEKIAAGCETACTNINAQVSLSPATISHHISELTAAGLIGTRREGKFVHYHVNAEIWTEFLARMKRVPKV